MQIASRRRNIALVRAAIRGLAEHCGLERWLISEIELCLGEAVTNVIKHAYRDRPDELVWVHWQLEEQPMAVHLAVCDRGLPMDPGLLARARREDIAVDRSADGALSEGGRGLALIKELMDVVSYRSHQGTNCLLMTRLLSGRVEASANPHGATP